ncbi:MAG: DUF1684 domain-containing protein, partial [Bacteroidota bacterium]
DPLETALDPRSRAVYDGLVYYAVDPAFRIAPEVEWIEDGEVVTLPATGTITSDYRRAALLRFTVDGDPHTLTAYESVETESDSLFIPFRDATSGRTTYGGGRYLSVPHPGANAATADLDFNKATNPSCAYSPAYSCPIPPEENTLSASIEAGVRKPPQALIEALDSPWPDEWTVVPIGESGYEVALPFGTTVKAETDAQGMRTVEGYLSVGTLGFMIGGFEVPLLNEATEEERAQIADLLVTMMHQQGEMDLQERWTEALPAGPSIAARTTTENEPVAVRFLVLDSWFLMLFVNDADATGWGLEDQDGAAVATRFFESLRPVE